MIFTSFVFILSGVQQLQRQSEITLLPNLQQTLQLQKLSYHKSRLCLVSSDVATSVSVSDGKGFTFMTSGAKTARTGEESQRLTCFIHQRGRTAEEGCVCIASNTETSLL